MSNVMMRLGQYSFSVDTAAYQELSRVSEYRWASQDRIGRMPALQATGPGSEIISLNGIIYPGHRGGSNQVRDLRVEASRLQPLILVDGRGFVHGRWVIERVEEGQSIFANNGAARKQTFRLQLRKYDDEL